MSISIPIINFGVLIRSEAQQLCIVIDTKNLPQMGVDSLGEELRRKRLECLDARDKNEYATCFNLTQGIVVFAKKHAEIDADHSVGKDLGVTVKEALSCIKEIFQNRYHSAPFHALAYENLQRYLKLFDEIGLELAKEAIPELEDIEDVLKEVKPQ